MHELTSLARHCLKYSLEPLRPDPFLKNEDYRWSSKPLFVGWLMFETWMLKRSNLLALRLNLLVISSPNHPPYYKWSFCLCETHYIYFRRSRNDPSKSPAVAIRIYPRPPRPRRATAGWSPGWRLRHTKNTPPVSPGSRGRDWGHLPGGPGFGWVQLSLISIFLDLFPFYRHVHRICGFIEALYPWWIS